MIHDLTIPFARAMIAIFVGLVLAAAPPFAREQLPSAEVRAVAFLIREVPKWKTENDCYSCHNNGDAARALIVAASKGHEVGAAMDDTLAWLRQPSRWNFNKPGPPTREPGALGVKTQGGIDDKTLARVQFAGALGLAVDAGRASRDALADAAVIVAADQTRDGSWQLDTSQSLGSPATYGTALATWAARRALVASHRDDMKPAIAKADGWLRAANVQTVVDAAAVLLGLEQATDAAAVAQRARALQTLTQGAAPSGGWGPYVSSAPQVFDTALALLALNAIERDAKIDGMIQRGRAYLIAQQLPDGSWPETTRPANQESYAQRISTTGWALLALMAQH